MPRPLPRGGLPTFRNHGRPRNIILQQQQQQQPCTWATVIRFSARHLFCSAHAPPPPPPQPALPTSVNISLSWKSRNRQNLRGHHTSRSTTRHSQNYSTATASSVDTVPRSSSDADQTSPDRERSETSIPPSISHSIQESASSKEQDNGYQTPATTTTTTTTTSISSTSSWQFPIKDRQAPVHRVRTGYSTNDALSRFYESLRHHQRYALLSSKSNHENTNDHNKRESLETVMVDYNYLSQLQEEYDTVLIPRRDTRTIFLLQSREPKTTANLKQLLRIATDLIWLHEKEKRRRKRSLIPQSSSSSSTLWSAGNETLTGTVPRAKSDSYHGLRVSEYTVLMNWIGSTKQLAILQESGPSISLLSEVPQDQDNNTTGSAARESESRSGSHRPSADNGSEDRNDLPQQDQHHQYFLRDESIDRAWAIWQDFSRTGMKPDVVLCTSLIDSLLKAGEIDRANQIWKYMGCPATSSTSSSTTKSRQRTLSVAEKVTNESTPSLDRIAKTLTNVAVTTTSSLSSLAPSSSSLSSLSSSISSGARASPNLQTLSVLMQAHVRERDLAGVTRAYRDILQHQQQQQQSSADPHPRDKNFNLSYPLTLSQPTMANSALLNQILTILLDLGETNAAKEIYSQTKAGTIGKDENYTQDIKKVSPSSRGPLLAKVSAPSSTSTSTSSPLGGVEGSAIRLPMHQQGFLRRSDWLRDRSRSNLSSPQTPRKSVLLRPDVSTMDLVLRRARQIRDWDWEDEILRDFQDLVSIEE